MNPNKENNLNYKKIVVRIYKLKNKYMKLIEKLKSIFIGSVLNVDALASIKWSNNNSVLLLTPAQVRVSCHTGHHHVWCLMKVLITR